MAEDLEEYINRLHGALEEIIQGADHKLQMASQRIYEIELQLESERASNKELQKKLSQITESANQVPDEHWQEKITEYQAREEKLQQEIVALQSELDSVQSSRNKDREDLQSVLTEFKGMLDQI
ncbi:MAG: hypothetical protein OXC82_02525 [Rhodobacteraceae bacterium]|nr:hypothetical protein [Paracoccaceae bacterium]MCY4249298.1 hypothetical protein [Paracoccaceae bacterium]